MDGLEATELSLIQVSGDNHNFRIDSEYFKKDYLKAIQRLKEIDADELRFLIPNIIHPTEILRVYEDEGIQIMLAQNIRNNHFDFSAKAFMHQAKKSELVNNEIKLNDVVLTRSGANFGQTACYKYNQEIFACADVLVLKDGAIPSGYLSTYLNTKYGRMLLDRGSYGMAQPHIAPPYLRGMLIPRFRGIEAFIDKLITQSVERVEQSKALYAEAENLLLDELELKDWQPSEENTAVKSLAESFGKTGRLDAEYYQSKYDQLKEQLQKICKQRNWTLENLGMLSAPLKYGSSAKLDYLEHGVPFLRIADVRHGRFDSTNLKRISLEAAKAERQSTVEKDDVIISRSGTLGLAVNIIADLNGAIFGSYFIRVRPSDNRINSDYLALYINSLVGQLQVEQINTGGIQTNLTIPVIESIQVVLPQAELQKSLVQKVKDSYRMQDASKGLLEIAKRGVEMAIERDEAAAAAWMESAARAES